MEQTELARRRKRTQLQLFGCTTSAGTAPSHFLTVYSPQIPQGSDLRLPMQEWSLTVHLRCERTLPGRAPGMTSRTSHCRVSPARPCSTSVTAQPHARHLQPKWQLLPHVYPSGSNCGATSIASDSHQSLSQSNPPWPSEPFNKEQVVSCPVNDFLQRAGHA